MQRLNKNLAISAFGKIRNSLKTGVIRQMETFFERMSLAAQGAPRHNSRQESW